MTVNAHRTYYIRCPVYGFVALNDWEWQIISQPAYQRLRRIRQLSWTDYVFPGAMHTRFEHSLGVMHMARCASTHDPSGAPRQSPAWQPYEEIRCQKPTISSIGSR